MIFQFGIVMLSSPDTPLTTMQEQISGVDKLEHEIIHNLRDGLIVCDSMAIIREINPAIERLFGYSSKEILGADIGTLLPDLSLANYRLESSVFMRCTGIRNNNDPFIVELNLTAVNIGLNSYFTLELRDISNTTRIQESVWSVAQELEQRVNLRTQELVQSNQELRHQISERQAMQKALQESEQRLRSVVTNAPVILFAVDRAGCFTFAEGRGLERLAVRPGDLVGQSLFKLLRNRPRFKKDFARILDGEQVTSMIEINDLIFECRYSIVKDARQEVVGVIGVATDITERKRAEERLLQLANYDSLTSLPNRTLFHDRLTHALAKARRQRGQVALLFLDLDRFKMINDSLGHHAGDELLKAVAQRLQQNARKGDTVARLGGDEFTVILEELTHHEDATTVARKIQDVMNRPFHIDGHEMFVTTSLGIAIFPQDGADIEELLKNADTAMYRAKEQGRNNYRFYTADMNAKAVEHLIMENRIRHALQRNEFILYYQPQIDLHRREITGLEALIRWHHPDLGLLYPNQFLPLAEDTGFITAIGDWVLHKACWQAAQWQRAGMAPLRIAVNLSPLQFTQPALVDSVAAALKNSGLDPGNLELEITENFLVDNVDNAIVTLRKLHELGVQLAIDDFGTGYSSLSYLKKFPLNSLKIDRSFVRDISTDEGDAAIAEAIIALAQTLRLRVMAEGVETEEQLHFLRNRGCDQAQGFLIGEPLPPEQVPAWCLDTGTYRAIFEQEMFWPIS